LIQVIDWTCHAALQSWYISLITRSDPQIPHATTTSDINFHGLKRLPQTSIPEHLMPSQHGFQFQLVAAHGRCGLLQTSSGNAHNRSQ
jgi:hypothetical protein